MNVIQNIQYKIFIALNLTHITFVHCTAAAAFVVSVTNKNSRIALEFLRSSFLHSHLPRLPQDGRKKDGDKRNYDNL